MFKLFVSFTLALLVVLDAVVLVVSVLGTGAGLIALIFDLDNNFFPQVLVYLAVSLTGFPITALLFEKSMKATHA